MRRARCNLSHDRTGCSREARDLLLPTPGLGRARCVAIWISSRWRERWLGGPDSRMRWSSSRRCELLAELGWEVASGFDETLGPAGTLGRDSQAEVVLVHRLRDALRSINPGVPDEAIEDGDRADRPRTGRRMDRVRANREVYRAAPGWREGRQPRSTASAETVTVRYIALGPRRVERLAGGVAGLGDRRAVQAAGRRRAVRQRHPAGVDRVQGAAQARPTTPTTTTCATTGTRSRSCSGPTRSSILSNGSETKVGSTYAPWESLRRVEEDRRRGRGRRRRARDGDAGHVRPVPAARPGRELRRLHSNGRAGWSRRSPSNHQYLGVNNADREPAHESASGRQSALGVFWHTQGSGKSLSMLWFTQKVLRKLPGNWTFVMVTDRKELDDQLHEEFADAGRAHERRRTCTPRRRRTCGSCSVRTTATCSR